MDFYNSDLPDRLQKALKQMNYESPTPIQEAAIPLALEGKDIIGRAQTGTGKTGAFAIPLVAQCMEDRKKQVLILAPTRELAAQIKDTIVQLTRFSNEARTALIVGGSLMKRQLQKLRTKPAIVIATPGRLMDHIRRKSIDLSKTSAVVLDEADRMLDMGFGPQIEEIIKALPQERQGLLFSATFPPKIRKLGESFLQNPESVEVKDEEQPALKIQQKLMKVKNETKDDTLVEILSTTEHKTLVFAKTKRGVDRLRRFLRSVDIPSTGIHGDRSQAQRETAIRSFRSGKSKIMVATDVASRGLHVDEIKLVINYDLPETSDDYTHRIGRTGRAGEEGTAISFVTSKEFSHWQYLQDPKTGKAMTFRRKKKKGGGSSFGKKSGGRFRGNGWAKSAKDGARGGKRRASSGGTGKRRFKNNSKQKARAYG